MNLEILDQWESDLPPVGTSISHVDHFYRPLKVGDYVYLPPGRTSYSYASHAIVAGETPKSVRLVILTRRRSNDPECVLSHIRFYNSMTKLVRVDDPDLIDAAICQAVRAKIMEMQ